jgi:hypothetical protein
VTNKFRQTPAESTDADGYKEVAAFLNVTKLANGGSTLTVELTHAARNTNDDYVSLLEWNNITTATTSVAYIDDFLRFLRVKAYWTTANTTTTADVELLVVPKVR